MYHPDLLRNPESCPALVLNADYTPLSYYPLSLWAWQTAVKAVFLERVDIVAQYDRKVHSPSFEMSLPSVIALRQYVRPSEHPAFTRFNLFLRDRFSCQYCGQEQELTFDHVVPRAKGGRTTWENVATACAPCNLRKGGRRPQEAHMHLRRHPFRPSGTVRVPLRDASRHRHAGCRSSTRETATLRAARPYGPPHQGGGRRLGPLGLTRGARPLADWGTDRAGTCARMASSGRIFPTSPVSTENPVADQGTIRENKLELVERLADDLAHEIKNPLHSMVINLEVLRRRLTRLELEPGTPLREGRPPGPSSSQRSAEISPVLTCVDARRCRSGRG